MDRLNPNIFTFGRQYGELAFASGDYQPDTSKRGPSMLSCWYLNEARYRAGPKLSTAAIAGKRQECTYIVYGYAKIKNTGDISWEYADDYDEIKLLVAAGSKVSAVASVFCDIAFSRIGNIG